MQVNAVHQAFIKTHHCLCYYNKVNEAIKLQGYGKVIFILFSILQNWITLWIEYLNL